MKDIVELQKRLSFFVEEASFLAQKYKLDFSILDSFKTEIRTDRIEGIVRLCFVNEINLSQKIQDDIEIIFI